MDDKPRNNIDDYGPACSKIDEWHQGASGIFLVLIILALHRTSLELKVCTRARRKINTKIEAESETAGPLNTRFNHSEYASLLSNL